MKQREQKASLAWRLIWRTYRRLGSWWGAMSFSVLLRIAKIICMPIFSSLMLGFIAVGDFRMALYSALAYGAMSLLHGIASPISYYLATKAEHHGYRLLMNQYFSRLIRADVEFFADNKTGYLTATVRGLGDSSLDFIRGMRRHLIETLISIVVPIVIIWTQSWLIGLVITVLGAGMVLFAKWSATRLQPIRQAAREALRENTGLIADTMTNIVAVRAAARERELSARMTRRFELEIREYMRRHFLAAKLQIGKEAIGFTFFGATALLVVWQSSLGALSFTVAVLIIQYLMTILIGCYNLNDDIEELADCLDKIEPAAEFFERQNKIIDRPGAKTLRHARGRIELCEVAMGYAGVPVFDGLSLKVEPGEKLGVVGVSGAGKTTLVKLILRFDDVTAGAVLIDGHDVRNLTQESLHRQIAYVPQEPLLFHDTIEANIRLGRPLATKTEVAAAVRAAHLTDFVNTLPQGLATIVGERGVKLSGGQKQRVAIARAILTKAPIMVLDEATSALDSESEAIIKDSFKQIFRGKTAVVVAHRLSTLRDMDRIIVIDRGKIIEDGSHLSLLRQGGAYARMWRKQSTLE